MRLHEIMGIESNRQWGVCSLNDFRKVGFAHTRRLLPADEWIVLVVLGLEE